MKRILHIGFWLHVSRSSFSLRYSRLQRWLLKTYSQRKTPFQSPQHSTGSDGTTHSRGIPGSLPHSRAPGLTFILNKPSLCASRSTWESHEHVLPNPNSAAFHPESPQSCLFQCHPIHFRDGADLGEATCLSRCTLQLVSELTLWHGSLPCFGDAASDLDFRKHRSFT